MWFRITTINFTNKRSPIVLSMEESLSGKHGFVKHECNQCSKQFTAERSLKMHIKSVHEGIKYACDQCDYQAGYQSHLTRHKKSSHEGVKYPCDQCDYQTGYRNNLKIHIRVQHEGVKYACSRCDYQVGYLSDLKKHMKSLLHEGAKKKQPKLKKGIQFISCPECGISFPSNKKMETHFLQIHDYIVSEQ